MPDAHFCTLLSSLEENKITELEVMGKKICLLRKGAAVYSFPATCPHAGARFCEGWMDALGRIVCPLHKYRFDPANGRNVTGEGYKLKIYPVEVRGEEVFVSF